MNEIKKLENKYITIQGFMVEELDLKGNELIIYALIYGFSQNENQKFNGNLQYIANWTNSTKQGVLKNLKSLIDKGFISKTETYINNIKFCEYYATKLNTLLNKNEQGIEQSLMGVLNNVEQGIKQSLPNNIYNNIYNNNNYNNKKKNINNINIINKKEKIFVKPTIEEINEYCKERKNNVDAETFYDFYESKGWKVGKNSMKNWKASVRTWEKNKDNNKKNNNSNRPSLDFYETI